MKVVGTIEARMGSSRLPGKTLMKIYDDLTLLECVVNRFRLAGSVSDVMVVTTVKKNDDPIVELCIKKKINYFRGSEEDVLDRVASAIFFANADAIVQMGADSAYLDFQLIDQLVNIYLKSGCDYVCNDMELSYPLGIYGHIVSADKLVQLNKRTDLSIADREDVVRYVFEHPDEYRIFNLKASKEFNFPGIRLTIDYPEDFQLAQEVYNHFKGYSFTTMDVLKLHAQRPELFEKTKKLVQHSAPFLKKSS
jgi:spore coat polysaccharide biosynthesis protein SpsF